MSASRPIRLIFLTFSAALMPAVANAEGLNAASIFAEAALSMQLIIVALLTGAVAAIVVTVRKVASGRHLTGGSAYLSALRLGAPLLGLLGAAFDALLWFIAMARVGVPEMQVLAPGFAEALFLVTLGLLVGVIGVICHWIVEARVDRAVLRA